jgi:pyrroline-5-carboxylate reductase
MLKAKIAFLGAGNMARSLVAGLVKDNYPASQIWVFDRNTEKCDLLSQLYDVHIAESLEQAVEFADVVILAVKPQNIKELATAIGKQIAQKQALVISIAAGVQLAELEKLFGFNTAIVRAMPNTPSIVQAGASGLFANERTSKEQLSLAEHIMRASGVVVWVKKEALIDSVTALSGSGPAYIFLIMECMEKAAIDMGLNEKNAHLLTLQTVYGAAKMALESPDSLEKLREQVTSKGGTTAAALNVFAKHQIGDIIAAAMQAAKNRSIELSALLNTPPQLHDQTGQAE